MAENSILFCFYSCYFTILSRLFVFFSLLVCCSHSANQLGPYNTFAVSSFSYPTTNVRPFDLRYIRVDLPEWFSSVSITVQSDVDLDSKSISKVPKSTLPLICIRDGSPPLPDVLKSSLIELGSFSNGSFQKIQNPQDVQCYPMQRNITVTLTNEQISPGVWYLGLFNGIGPTRSQSKMIIRRPSYSFSANISVEGCATSTMWGQYCNQTIDTFSCFLAYRNNPTEIVSGANLQTIQNVVSCKNFGSYCHGEGEPKVYALEVLGIAEQLKIVATNVSFTAAPATNSTGNASVANLFYFARHGAMPSMTLYDYSGDISRAPLIIRTPKVGRWFVTILPTNISKEVGGIQNTNMQVCYSITWQVLNCPVGKAGLNCSSEKYILQTVIRRDSTPFESYYLPLSGKVSPDSANFPLEPLSSNSSYSNEIDNSWTYFLLNIPRGAAGGNIHIRMTSDTKINYEIYARYGGLPSLDSLQIPPSALQMIRLSCQYLLRDAPKKCSSHGACKVALDASGLASYSFCSCDRTHGGFDCSVEIVSHQGHLWQSIALIGSNAAAILPAYWALRHKAFAEWVIFTSSGISSGLYHACDVGTWCVLSFGVLQFMDFWLSFMAVVSTFVYLTTVDEVFKRAIHTVVAIFTALMAITKATRSSNIILVVAIGALGLLIGWLVEFFTSLRSLSFSRGFCLNVPTRWETIGVQLSNLVKTLLRRFQWGFVLAGFSALAMAAISWKLESSESYWIWHSLWHITIYTSSFLFLCSKVDIINNENQTTPDGNYELTRMGSFSRAES
ncbi:FIVE-SPAN TRANSMEMBRANE PROTEIN M83 [Salix koriyanagi]|uniref:FIVE-SPAN TRANSMEMBRANE PROTEIN M83 n=1 Tax=Salix koriyanagi TaxID=2511006 RepID=A0A9Q0U3W5_9ROSI|nr:FIVE-SPAN TRANSMEMBRANE PROTEIN M83 [Salix koriyanagi]